MNNSSVSTADFDIAAASVTEGGKARGGDCFCVCEIAGENTLVLAVADGVSSSACDWLASETVCRKAVERMVEEAGDIKARLTRSVHLAHNAVQQLGGRCAASLATLVIVVWRRDADKVWYASIGDSRLYKAAGSEMAQISRDDKAAVLIRRDGKPMMVGGQPVFKFGLSSAMGQQESLAFEVTELEFAAGDALLLATDGAHGEGRFVTGAVDVLGCEALAARVEAYVRHLSGEYEDDATLVVLRRNDCAAEAEELLRRAIAEGRDCRESGVGAHIANRMLLAEVKRLLDAGDYDAVNRALDYGERYGVRFGRESLIELLTAASAHVPRHIPTIMSLRRLAAKA